MKTHKAAKSLGIHPLNLLLRLQGYVASFEECWPDVDSGYIETLKQEAQWDSAHSERPSSPAETKNQTTSAPAPKSPSVSPAAAKVIEKLCQHKHWGNNKVPWDKLHRHYCKGVNNLKEEVDSLVREGLLLKTSDGHAFSLNSDRKVEIVKITQESIARGKH